VRQKQRKQEVFVQKQAIGTRLDGVCNFWSESEECLEARNSIDAHTQINDDKVWIRREVNGFSLNTGRHKNGSLLPLF
jgi:hypothetical protein